MNTPSPSRKALGGGVYKDDRKGTYWIRLSLNGKRTWRRLDAKTERFAKEEARAKLSDYARSKVGTAKSPFARAVDTFDKAADTYLEAQCPDRRLQTRDEAFCAVERDRIKYLKKFFGRTMISEIRLPLLPRYKDWRVKNRLKKHFSGLRSVDLELVTLSNVLSYSVSLGHLDINWIQRSRPRFQIASNVKHSRERSIESGDVLNAIANYFFKSPKSAVMGWLTLFSGMTGCRNTELLGLRRDAKNPDDPGFIEGGYLFIRRAKSGLNPYLQLTGEFGETVDAFLEWRDLHFIRSPWFFPGRPANKRKSGKEVSSKAIGELHGRMRKDSFRHALYRASQELGLPRCSPHGLRSFYVTKRRSDGAPDIQIAAEIGDRTVSLISQTYGDVPPNWFGKHKISFRPSTGEPAWKLKLWKKSEEQNEPPSAAVSTPLGES